MFMRCLSHFNVIKSLSMPILMRCNSQNVGLLTDNKDKFTDKPITYPVYPDK